MIIIRSKKIMKKKNKLPVVQVLMSTFNGEKYIETQVESIMYQKDVDVSLLIRDDGSQDRTIDKIQELQKKYSNKIFFYFGSNMGYKKSFVDLIKHADLTADYYAFADQDDFWLPMKLKEGIGKIIGSQQEYKLYASTVIICNENLKPVYKKDISNYIPGFSSTMTRVRLAGCTMIFNKAVVELYKKINFSKKYVKTLPSHDGFMMDLVTAVGGFIYVDQDSYIYHRRLNNSVTGGGNGIRKRFTNEYQRLFKEKYESSSVAQILKYQLNSYVTNENKLFIDKVINYRNHPLSTFSLIFSRKINCGIKIANLETRFKIGMRLF